MKISSILALHTIPGKKIKIAEGLIGYIFGIKDHLMIVKLGSVTYQYNEILVPAGDSYSEEHIPGITKHGSQGGKFFNRSVIIVDYIKGYLFIPQKDKEIAKKE